VVYIINSGASATAGETFYNTTCRACHGEPGVDGNNGRPEGGIAAFLQTDGAYSEFVHKARWGIPDTIMTRSMLGEPTSQNMIDVMLYLQNYVTENTEFTVTDGTSGTWYLLARDGEGFVLDVFEGEDGQWNMVATYYTYDGMGNPIWLIGNATVTGDGATVPVVMASGGIFGPAFDPTTVNRVEWGTLQFTFNSCTQGNIAATPNQAMQDSGMGFEPVEFDITRVTPPSGCP
jgi:cytochrome c2